MLNSLHVAVLCLQATVCMGGEWDRNSRAYLTIIHSQ